MSKLSIEFPPSFINIIFSKYTRNRKENFIRLSVCIEPAAQNSQRRILSETGEEENEKRNKGGQRVHRTEAFFPPRFWKQSTPELCSQVFENITEGVVIKCCGGA